MKFIYIFCNVQQSVLYSQKISHLFKTQWYKLGQQHFIYEHVTSKSWTQPLNWPDVSVCMYIEDPSTCNTVSAQQYLNSVLCLAVKNDCARLSSVAHAKGRFSAMLV